MNSTFGEQGSGGGRFGGIGEFSKVARQKEDENEDESEGSENEDDEDEEMA